jgi:hypothetical protein
MIIIREINEQFDRFFIFLREWLYYGISYKDAWYYATKVTKGFKK